MASPLGTFGLVILALAATGSMAQQPSSSGSGASNTCTNAIASLSPCLAFITANSSSSSPRRPSAACCSQLSNMVQATPQCLCTLVSGGGPSFITINRTMALNLPGACKSRTPPLSQCPKDDAEGPGSSPSESSQGPAGSTNKTPPADPADITPTGSDVPFTDDYDGSTSDATTIFGRASVQPMLLYLLIAVINYG